MAALNESPAQTNLQPPASGIPVVGLEIHARLRTRTKIFCGCRNIYGAQPNQITCPVCLGLPGSLPVLNEQAVTLAIRIGLATGCTINERSVFARKHYFYHDLPKNFQITQYDQPLGEDGSLRFYFEGTEQSVAISRIHLEEDAGKTSTGDGGGIFTRIDLNRAGTPLVEIVTAPGLSSGAQAHAFLSGLRRLLVWLEVCDGDMSTGSLRCDANISLRRPGADAGARTEIKNLNSCRALRLAVDYEIERQRRLLAGSSLPRAETRSWDASRNRTVFMRSKEGADDYRYFPEPDLPPLLVPDRQTEAIAATMPELPLAVQKRLCRQYGITGDIAFLLCTDPDLVTYFEAVCTCFADGPVAANWIVTEVLQFLNATGNGINGLPVTPEQLAELLDLVHRGDISGRQAKDVWQNMIAGKGSASEIVTRHEIRQNSDKKELMATVEQVLAENTELVVAYRAGRTRVLTHLMGRVMQQTAGQANPALARVLLHLALEDTQ